MYQTQGWQVPQMRGRRPMPQGMPMQPMMQPPGQQNALLAMLRQRQMGGQPMNALAMGRPFPQFGGYGR